MTSWRVTKLRCEYLENPLGLDERHPRLSWILEAKRRGARQTAWRVWVASSLAKLRAGQGDLWDSGRVAEDRSIQVPYAGAPLLSRQSCHWRVQVWDETGASARSAPARWTMGLLEPSDWRARWIAGDSDAGRGDDPEAILSARTEPGRPLYLRTEFEVPGSVRRATIYASARGVFELHLGGLRVGVDCFAPEWTDYDRRIQFRTYDVTALVSPGRNALGAILAGGWWSGFVGWQETRGRYGLENSLLVQLEVETGDGTTLTVGTDRSWRCQTGPIRSADFMMGEVYDARRERPGWDRPGLAVRGWRAVREVAPPAVPLVAQRSEPVRITGTLKPVSVIAQKSGAYLCNLGQNITGWIQLKVKGRRGTRITLRHGERLNPDGTLYTENLRRAKATDVYILKGAGKKEAWAPRFTFHGFQYVEVTGLASAPAAGDLVGCAVHSATPPAGGFACSHPGVNRLWLNGRWSQRDNFLSVPTDCPQRDERLGWTGDAQVFLRTATYNMNVAAFFTKWMIDVEDGQTATGAFPDTAPRLREGGDYVGLDGLEGAAGWADAGVIVPWTLWQIYGDQRVIERHWRAMTAWLDYLERGNPDGVRRNDLGNNYGDWLCLPSDTAFRTQSPMKTLLATAYWADDAVKMAEMAVALGRTADARRFAAMAGRVRAAFQKEFSLGDGRLSVETQTAYLLALAMDLLPPEQRAHAAAHLVSDLRAQDWHLSTGFIGIRYLNPVLTETGHADVAYRLLLRDDYPSWLYPVRHGATTIWERWNGWTEREGFFNPHMNSFNHYALGSVGEWLYRHVAGIEVAEPGFKRSWLRPYPGGGLKFARAHYDTPYGRIFSAWKRSGDAFRWKIRVPVNTTAHVCVPSVAGTTVREGGKPLARVAGIRLGRRESGYAVCEVGSGDYLFESTWRE